MSEVPDGSTRSPQAVGFQAVVLAGGRSARLGGSPKALLRTAPGAPTLVETTVGALLSEGVEAGRVVVVGPQSLPRMPVLRTREDPPFAGPAAGIAAGLTALEHAVTPKDRATAPRTAWTVVLACDMPGVQRAISALMAAALQAAPDERGIVVVDDGRLQPLAGIYRSSALGETVSGQATTDRSVRSLIGALWDRQLPLAGATDDVDTWDDVSRFGLEPPPGGASGPPGPETPEGVTGT